MTLSVFRPVRPEIVGHLLRAGSELFLAMQAAVDARGEELGGPAQYRTRPSGEDRHRMTEPTAVGIDVGATKAEAVLVTADATIHARALADTPATDGHAVLEAMRSVAEQVRDPNAVAIGVGAAGLVELRHRPDAVRAEHRVA